MSIDFRPLSRQYWFTTPLMRSHEVWQAQMLLNTFGASLKADGIFGMATRDAILTFQRRKGLREDGILGPITWKVLHGVPALQEFVISARDVLAADAIKQLGTWHRRYPDSQYWRLTDKGIEVKGQPVLRIDNNPGHVCDVARKYTPQVAAAAVAFPVPFELIIATICTESSGRPKACRYEPGCDPTNPERTPHRVSVGLMQTLLSTAREALGEPTLSLAQLENPATSIRAGMAYMWRQARETGFDPPLVAAAYNAGRVRHDGGSKNIWKLRQFPIGTGKHVDRFIGYFNACFTYFTLQDLQVAAQTPSFVSILKSGRTIALSTTAPGIGGSTAPAARHPVDDHTASPIESH